GYYEQALAADPDNLLARSYLGQGFVAVGNLTAARAQLQEIRARGGRETWAEFALETSIRTSRGYAY
ncbi:MAG: tetratricopeptide repeat protein, partial [Pseudomonadota bacterium]